MRNINLIYEEYSLNAGIYKKLEEATVTEDFEERNSILKVGMDLLTQRNKALILLDKYGWETAAAYGADPVPAIARMRKRLNVHAKRLRPPKMEKPN